MSTVTCLCELKALFTLEKQASRLSRTDRYFAQEDGKASRHSSSALTLVIYYWKSFPSGDPLTDPPSPSTKAYAETTFSALVEWFGAFVLLQSLPEAFLRSYTSSTKDMIHRRINKYQHIEVQNESITFYNRAITFDSGRRIHATQSTESVAMSAFSYLLLFTSLTSPFLLSRIFLQYLSNLGLQMTVLKQL